MRKTLFGMWLMCVAVVFVLPALGHGEDVEPTEQGAQRPAVREDSVDERHLVARVHRGPGPRRKLVPEPLRHARAEQVLARRHVPAITRANRPAAETRTRRRAC